MRDEDPLIDAVVLSESSNSPAVNHKQVLTFKQQQQQQQQQ